METATLSSEIKTQFKVGLLIWLIAAFFTFYQSILQSSPSLMITQLHKDLGMSLQDIGWLTASFYFIYIPMQIPAGLIVDRLGARKLLTVCVFITAIATIIFSISHEARLNYGARVMMGLVTAPSICAVLFLIGNWLPRNRFAIFVGLTEMIFTLGGALGEEMLSLSVDKWGWRMSMFTIGVLGIGLTILTWVIVRDRPVFSVPAAKPEGRLFRSMWQDLMILVKNKRLWISTLCSGALFAPLPAFAALWAIPFLRDVYHYSLEQAAFASSLIFWGAAVGTPIIGYLSEYLDRRKILLTVSCIGSLVAFLCVSYIHFEIRWDLFGCLFLLGFLGSGYVIGFAIARDICPPAQRSAGMGFVNAFCLMFGTILLQPLFGKLLTYHHMHYLSKKLHTAPLIASDFQFASISIAAVLALGFILSFMVEETYCLPQY